MSPRPSIRTIALVIGVFFSLGLQVTKALTYHPVPPHPVAVALHGFQLDAAFQGAGQVGATISCDSTASDAHGALCSRIANDRNRIGAHIVNGRPKFGAAEDLALQAIPGRFLGFPLFTIEFDGGHCLGATHGRGKARLRACRGAGSYGTVFAADGSRLINRAITVAENNRRGYCLTGGRRGTREFMGICGVSHQHWRRYFP